MKLSTGPQGLYMQVLVAVFVGALLGHFVPDFAVQLQPLGEGFVKLVRMLIAPIIFVTVVVGIARLQDSAGVGRIGLQAILYFELMTTLAMVIGLAVAFLARPGAGMNVDPAHLDAAAVARYTTGPHLTVTEFLLNIIPNTVVDAFSRGEILQVLLFAVLFGMALARLGNRGRTIVAAIDEAGAGLFIVIGYVMRVAPVGALGAMAFTVGKYGIGTLAQLGLLMLCFYATCAIFILGALAVVMALCGLNLYSLLRYLKEEFFIVLGTSSSEAALPTLIEKLEGLGLPRGLVGLVVPLGYAFNLDGSSIYFTMAIAFIAQALNIDLGWSDYALILGVLLLTSKGAAAITGGGFITLAATLATLHGKVPVNAIVLILGIDRFMSEARAITNLFGNAVATIVVARWQGELDVAQVRAVLSGNRAAALPEPA